MHKWIYKGQLLDNSQQDGRPLFECSKCGFQLVSYIGNLVEALQSLINNNHTLVKCQKENLNNGITD